MKLVPKFKTQAIRETVPGKDVSIGITMSPIAAPCPPPADCPCAPSAVGWLIQPTPGTDYTELVGGVERTRHAWVLPDVLPSLDGDELLGKPVFLRLGSLPLWGDPTVPTVDQSWLLLGAPFGDAAGIVWEWSTVDQSPVTLPTTRPTTPTDSAWWEGVQIEQVGQFVQVRILPGYILGYMVGGEWRANIYATAFCGGTEIGMLEIEILVSY